MRMYKLHNVNEHGEHKGHCKRCHRRDPKSYKYHRAYSLSTDIWDRNMTKWKDISKERPPFHEYIFVWDMINQKEMLILYLGTEEIWERTKNNFKFPLWRLALEIE